MLLVWVPLVPCLVLILVSCLHGPMLLVTCYNDLYAALRPAMKRLYQSNQLQKAILEKLSVYQDYKIPPEEVAKLF